MPKHSMSSFRDSADSPDEDDVLDLSDEISDALDANLDAVDPEAAAFVAPKTGRASSKRAPRSSSKSAKDAPSKNASARTREGDAFSRRAARENNNRNNNNAREAEYNSSGSSGASFDVFPTASWRKTPKTQAREKNQERDFRAQQPQHHRDERLRAPRKSSTASTLIFEISGVFLMAAGAVLLFNAVQTHSEGWLPRVGVNMLRLFFGLGAVVFPLLMMALGLLLIARRQRANVRAFFGGIGVAFPVFLTAMHLQVASGQEFVPVQILWHRIIADGMAPGLALDEYHGGAVGAVFSVVLRKMLGDTGAVIALVALSVVALLILTNLSLAETVGRAGRGVKRGAKKAGSKTRRVWRRGVELAYEKPQDPFARQLEKNREEHQNEYDEPRQALPVRERPVTPSPLRRPSNGVSAPRPVSSVRPAPPFGVIAEDNFVAPEFMPNSPPAARRDAVRHDALRRDALQAEASGMKRAAPFFDLSDVLRGDLPPVQNAPSASPIKTPVEAPIIETPAPQIKESAKELRAVPGQDAAPRIEIVDAPPPPSVLDSVLEESTSEAVPINRPDDELTPQEALEAQAQASAKSSVQDDDVMPEIARKPKRAGRPQRRFGDGPLMPDYFDEAVRALDPPVRMDHSGAEEDIQEGVLNVQETLASFKIDARVTDVKRGPVITRYEVQPAPGVRVAAIANLDRDLARSLSAIAVRIEAPVPGKNVVGIEVPNKKVNLVRLRDVLELPEFLSSQSKLNFVLGKDIAGQAKWSDLTKMPHLLIAGATNSGKSVCLNAIITSIISRATPEEVKFSLIDPKRVELTLYKDIPHLYHPVVVEPKEAVRALRGMINEMDRRYKKFAERGVRNIASYNSKLEDGEDALPYIVIVIDELADLMMTAAAEFEKLICRLAQLARATGIHLIVATQRPSVNVITGVIKANIPARIAFAVASQVDSRTILDSVGAERLIGSGDMLFDANNGGKAVRIQGAFLSEEECNRIVQVVKAAYKGEDFDYGLDLDAVEDDDSSSGSDKVPSDEKRDGLYDQIKEFVLRHDEMSASNIQRKFEIGYPRAGRIVDQLERDGIVGPADGPKARKVLGGGG